MFGLTPIPPFLVDALSFAVSVTALVRVKRKEFLAAAHSQGLPSLKVGTVLAASGAGRTRLAYSRTLPGTGPPFPVADPDAGADWRVRPSSCIRRAFATAHGTDDNGAWVHRSARQHRIQHISHAARARGNTGQSDEYRESPLLRRVRRRSGIGLPARREFGIAHAVTWLFATTLGLAAFSLCVPLLRYRERPNVTVASIP